MLPYFEFNIDPANSDKINSEILLSDGTILVKSLDESGKLIYFGEFRNTGLAEQGLEKFLELRPKVKGSCNRIIWGPDIYFLHPADNASDATHGLGEINWGNDQVPVLYNMSHQDIQVLYGIRPSLIDKISSLLPACPIVPIIEILVPYIASLGQGKASYSFALLHGKSLYLTGFEKGELKYSNVFPLGDPSSLAYFVKAGAQLFIPDQSFMVIAGQINEDKEWIKEFNQILPDHQFDRGLNKSRELKESQPQESGYYRWFCQ